MIRLRFLGAAGTVTGSRYLLDWRGHRFMVDCGLFQGSKELRLRNREPFAVPADSVEAVVLTHAHIDHSGYLPLLRRTGFTGPIHATGGTRDLCALLLPDSAQIQEEEAAYANRHKTSKHQPALPLYTRADAEACLGRFQDHPYRQPFQIVPGVQAVFRDAGHILGSARIELLFEGDPPRRLVFSGDLGRLDAPILRDPEPLEEADWLVLESTYGDRVHTDHPVEQNLRDLVRSGVQRGGVIVVPAFAVERTQEVVYLLDELLHQGGIPSIPVYVDSPMAVRAFHLFQKYPEYYDEDARRLLEAGRRVLSFPGLRLCETVEDSKAINRARPPFLVVSASGMATGGRVLHHLKRYLPDPANTVLLVGYQAVGTRGWRLQQGEESVRIFGESVRVRAWIDKLDGFSGHADSVQLERWATGLARPPRRVFLTHGEPEALEAQRVRLASMPGWEVHVPAHDQEVILE